MTLRVFLLGAGYSARAYARLVAAETYAIHGTTRSVEKATGLLAAGIEPVLFDGTAVSDEMAEALAETTELVVSAAPATTTRREAAGGEQGVGDKQRSGDPLLSVLQQPLSAAMPSLRWIGYLSSVGVYGNHDGAWVDEDAELRPVSARATARVAAERDWLAAGDAAGVPVAVLRLSGIYGPGRNALANLAAGTARRTVKPGQVFNRIHVDDIAGALAFLGAHELGGVFNVTDDEPGPPQDVVAYAAGLMGVAPPPEVPYDQVEMTPMARSFWRDNKRVSNTKLKAAGYAFRFPDHRRALDTMWSDGSWVGEAGTGGSNS